MIRVIAGAVALCLVAGACSGDDDRPPPTTTTTTEVAASGDLAHLAEQIVALHPDPFHHVTEAELAARTVEDPADPDELLVAAMRLANLGAGEGHGGIYPWSQPALEAWPIQLYDFDDGMRAVGGAGAPIGARLVAVGDAPIADVVAAVRPLVPHDTEGTIRARLPGYLAFPAVLRGLGFDPTELTWELPSGETATVAAPAAVSTEAFGTLLGLFQAQVPPSLPYDRDRQFWSERRGDVLYVRWNRVQTRDGDTSLSELATAMVDDVETGRVTRVVIDARHNPGGEIDAATALVLGVREIERAHKGTVRFLVGRSTFSAATIVIGQLVHDIGVTVVGEPSGGSQRSYGDAQRVDLPTSGIVAFVNTRRYDSGDRVFEPIVPDIAVAPTWGDGDPALDAASR